PEALFRSIEATGLIRPEEADMLRWFVLGVLVAGTARGIDGTLRRRVLLQGALGSRGRIHPALQEEPLPGPEARDRVGSHPAGRDGGAQVPRDRGRPLGLPRHDRVEERRRAARALPRSGAQAAVPR